MSVHRRRATIRCRQGVSAMRCDCPRIRAEARAKLRVAADFLEAAQLLVGLSDPQLQAWVSEEEGDPDLLHASGVLGVCGERTGARLVHGRRDAGGVLSLVRSSERVPNTCSRPGDSTRLPRTSVLLGEKRIYGVELPATGPCTGVSIRPGRGLRSLRVQSYGRVKGTGSDNLRALRREGLPGLRRPVLSRDS